MMITNKWLKSAIYAFVGAFIGVFILLCIAVSAKNTTIKKLKLENTEYTKTIDSLEARCERYGQMEGISVNTTFVINNKNIMSLTSNVVNNVTRNYAVMTKEEVLNALDSLQRINKSK